MNRGGVGSLRKPGRSCGGIWGEAEAGGRVNKGMEQGRGREKGRGGGPGEGMKRDV